MKNMFKSNKKGFTLVELLAVIVILALLIVITMNTIVPLLGRTKETGAVTYAKRVLNNALTNLEADKIISGELKTNESRYYKISQELTDADSYFGCVKVTNSSGTYKYEIKMFSNNDKLYLKSTYDASSGHAITDVTDLEGKVTISDYGTTYKANTPSITTADSKGIEDSCFNNTEDGTDDAAWGNIDNK